MGAYSSLHANDLEFVYYLHLIIYIIIQSLWYLSNSSGVDLNFSQLSALGKQKTLYDCEAYLAAALPLLGGLRSSSSSSSSSLLLLPLLSSSSLTSPYADVLEGPATLQLSRYKLFEV